MIKIIGIFMCIAPIILIGSLVGYCFNRYMEYISEQAKKAYKRKERLAYIESQLRRQSSLRMNTGQI